MLTVSLVAALYCLAGAGLIFGIWLVYDVRSAKVWREQRRQRVYHCVKCGTLFEGPAARRTESCPRCGFEMTYLQF
ncbi:MAG: hypothetical protein ACFB21_05915 [Opitutales bacterium]